MFWNRDRGATATLPEDRDRTDHHRLRALIDQATGDSVDESDEHIGLVGTVRQEVDCPFRARLDGEVVECVRIERPRNGYGLNVVCRSRGKAVVVDISRLEWDGPRPRGYEWIEAYLAWRELMH